MKMAFPKYARSKMTFHLVRTNKGACYINGVLLRNRKKSSSYTADNRRSFRYILEDLFSVNDELVDMKVVVSTHKMDGATKYNFVEDSNVGADSYTEYVVEGEKYPSLNWRCFPCAPWLKRLLRINYIPKVLYVKVISSN